MKIHNVLIRSRYIDHELLNLSDSELKLLTERQQLKKYV